MMTKIMMMILIGKKTFCHLPCCLALWLPEVFENISESNTKPISINIKDFHFRCWLIWSADFVLHVYFFQSYNFLDHCIFVADIVARKVKYSEFALKTSANRSLWEVMVIVNSTRNCLLLSNSKVFKVKSCWGGWKVFCFKVSSWRGQSRGVVVAKKHVYREYITIKSHPMDDSTGSLHYPFW